LKVPIVAALFTFKSDDAATLIARWISRDIGKPQLTSVFADDAPGKILRHPFGSAISKALVQIGEIVFLELRADVIEVERHGSNPCIDGPDSAAGDLNRPGAAPPCEQRRQDHHGRPV
jgi:hypothetical protein